MPWRAQQKMKVVFYCSLFTIHSSLSSKHHIESSATASLLPALFLGGCLYISLWTILKTGVRRNPQPTAAFPVGRKQWRLLPGNDRDAP